MKKKRAAKKKATAVVPVVTGEVVEQSMAMDVAFRLKEIVEAHGSKVSVRHISLPPK